MISVCVNYFEILKNAISETLFYNSNFTCTKIFLNF